MGQPDEHRHAGEHERVRPGGTGRGPKRGEQGASSQRFSHSNAINQSAQLHAEEHRHQRKERNHRADQGGGQAGVQCSERGRDPHPDYRGEGER